ncbi:unnamed protein product [Dibothriocephalus latus]|uniref:Uncharacterized protein n=1 Tax=Dibothriocephalus latus TaxID=60516 RepID=A0A3P7REX0_DIBLA|nr:unnamed protein product [Dibothriocephalus latus]
MPVLYLGDSRQAAPTNEPMPNPWAPSSAQTNTSGASATPTSGTTAPGRTTGGAANPFAFNPEAMSNAFQVSSCRAILSPA